MLAVFDQPDMMSSCGARGQSVHALQSLTLMNSDFMTRQSRALARRLWTDMPGDETARIHRLFELTLNRPPNTKELESTRRFLRAQTKVLEVQIARREKTPDLQIPGRKDSAETLAWVDLCLAALNRNEFLYIQ
jgi:hypothetical protein